MAAVHRLDRIRAMVRRLAGRHLDLFNTYHHQPTFVLWFGRLGLLSHLRRRAGRRPVGLSRGFFADLGEFGTAKRFRNPIRRWRDFLFSLPNQASFPSPGGDRVRVSLSRTLRRCDVGLLKPRIHHLCRPDDCLSAVARTRSPRPGTTAPPEVSTLAGGHSPSIPAPRFHSRLLSETLPRSNVLARTTAQLRAAALQAAAALRLPRECHATWMVPPTPRTRARPPLSRPKLPPSRPLTSSAARTPKHDTPQPIPISTRPQLATLLSHARLAAAHSNGRISCLSNHP